MEDYREKNRSIQRMLEERRREEEELRQQAAADPLTGLYNRQYADEKIESMLKQKIPLPSVFGFGRTQICQRSVWSRGRRPLYSDDYGSYPAQLPLRKRSALQIWRDEFLILFEGLLAEKAEEKAEAINRDLGRIGCDGDFPYSMSLSYGVVESPSYSDGAAMIQEADRKMYEQKRKNGGHVIRAWSPEKYCFSITS